MMITQLILGANYGTEEEEDDSNSFFCFSQSLRSFLYILFVIFSPAASTVGMPR